MFDMRNVRTVKREKQILVYSCSSIFEKNSHTTTTTTTTTTIKQKSTAQAPDKLRVRNRKLFFLFLNQTICCGYSKEPSRYDGSFEHPKHMFKLMGKKKHTLLR